MSSDVRAFELKSLSLERVRQLNVLADQFEKELLSSGAPSVSDFVAQLDDPHEKLVLLRLLTFTEAEIRRNETPAKAFAFGRVQDVPEFEIRHELGRGGMGIVYLARSRALDRLVALKVLHARWQDRPGLRRRFSREAEAAAKCDHPNLVRLYQVGEHDGHPYLALEYVEGTTLVQALAGAPQPARGAAALVEKLARAVDHAHRQGVVHRDLKPANVLITKDGEPKITDFGLAKLIDDRRTQTREDTILGTLAYMAPEQAGGLNREVGPGTDVHALGAILYEALTGKLPFRAASSPELLRKIVAEDAVRPSWHRPDVPRDLEVICLKCLEKAPNRRYRTAGELADDLRRFLENRPIVARPVAWPGQLSRWARRNPLGAVACAALGAAVVATAVFAIRTREAEREERRQRERALAEAANAEAINAFVRTDLLAPASTLHQAIAGQRPDPDLKVRTALDRAAAKIGTRFVDRPILEASIRQTIGESYYELGLYPRARAQLQRTVDLRRRWEGDANPDTLRAIGSLGAVYLSDGKLKEAEPLLRDALRGLQSALGPEHPDTLTAIGRVAAIDTAMQNFAEAETLLVSLRETYRRTGGDDAPETLETAGTLATVYLGQGKPARAGHVLGDAIARVERAMDGEHPLALALRAALADVYTAENKKAEAEQLYKEVVKAQRKVEGDRHPDTLATLAKLGTLYTADGKTDKAEPLLKEALDGCRAALDRNHEATDAALAGLAAVYAVRRDLPRLGAVMEEAARIAVTRWGLNDETAARGCESAALYFFTVEDYLKAEIYFRDCLTYFTAHAPDHRDRYVNELLYGVCLLAQKKLTQAQVHLLLGYNGITHRREEIPPPDRKNLGALMEQVLRLTDADGRLLVETTALGKLRNDSALRAIVFDLQFPADPFAPGR